MINFLRFISDRVNGFAKGLLLAAACTMVTAVFLQIIFRYVLKMPLSWSEELARYAFMWTTFLGASVALRYNSLPNITMGVKLLPIKMRPYLFLVTRGIAALFCYHFLVEGTRLAIAVIPDKTPALDFTISWAYAALPVGGLFMLIHTLYLVAEESQEKLGNSVLGIGVMLAVAAGFSLITSQPFEQINLLLIVLLLLFFGMSVPIFVSLAMVTVVAFTTTGDIPLTIVPQRMFVGLDSFTLMAVPFFMLAGAIMHEGGIALRLINFASSLVGWIRGGLIPANVLASVIFADMSGSAASDTAAIGNVMMPGMIKRGYEKNFVTALQAAAGSLGVQFPPSSGMLLYAFVANVSITHLFMASFIPGFLVALSFIITGLIIARRHNYPAEKWVGFKNLGKAFIHSIWALFTPILILGGILGGLFTATEAGAVTVVYALLVSTVFYKELPLSKIPEVVTTGAVNTARVMSIASAGMLLAWYLASQQIPQEIAGMLFSITNDPFWILVIVNIFLILIHTVLETGTCILVVVPILLPAMLAAGVDPIHFGIIVAINSALGMILPPIGICLFVSTAITNISLEAVTKAVWPFALANLIVLSVVTACPWIVQILPGMMGMLK
ncbi:TRAP transporter large permease subunit [Pelosinus sp. UFO1]|uniref:TRAP transporter large permease n=1 Tax=Pelosinus sp. UFO1 TaxID=484770 RepID=UPI0004D12776|nr:TRAP transporter large permease subunit [Pelosinus sp. UFO1]AIF53580.1 TRAP dicarboxylate transporter, DctM subunit [Pelosinus sp. UFO1]